jgi:cytochrome c5
MMKKLVVLIAFASLTAGASMALAGSKAATGINGSMHDINVAGGGTYKADLFSRTCAFCHTPHNAQANGATPAPLWNHAVSTVKLDPYVWASPLNTGITFAGDPLIGPSRLCMGCHDGIAAVDSHGSAGSFNGGATPLRSSYTDQLGGTAKRYIDDLTVTHPIGFKYSDAVLARNTGTNADGKQLVLPGVGFIKDATTLVSGATTFDTNDLTSTIRSNTTQKTIGDTLYNGYFTCASCHDVHNSVNAAPLPATIAAGNSYNYFIYAQEEGSAICLSCHIK